jgi:hypothetical protein
VQLVCRTRCRTWPSRSTACRTICMTALPLSFDVPIHLSILPLLLNSSAARARVSSGPCAVGGLALDHIEEGGACLLIAQLEIVQRSPVTAIAHRRTLLIRHSDRAPPHAADPLHPTPVGHRRRARNRPERHSRQYRVTAGHPAPAISRWRADHASRRNARSRSSTKSGRCSTIQ